jgi:hypothetical protein
MGNRKSREYRKRPADEYILSSAWIAAREVPRRFEDDVHIPRLGRRRVQVVVAPSFEQGYGWDLWTTDGAWRVFLSRVVTGEWPGRLSGYEELVAPGARIQQHFEQLCAVSIPMLPLLNQMVGLDGTYSMLMIAGDLYSALRVAWWSEYPAHWQTLVQQTDELVATLRQCEVMDGHE